MAGRKKLPVAVLEERGASQFSKAALQARRESELKVPERLRRTTAPAYLAQVPGLVERFDELAAMLSAIMPENFGALDAPILAQYVVFEREFEDATQAFLSCADSDEAVSLQKTQVEAFKNAKAAASSLGMFVTDRCKLVAVKGEREHDPAEDLM